MLRLNTIENHFSAQVQEIKSQKNLLEKYRKMSKLEPEFIMRSYNHEINFEQLKIFAKIIDDKSLFESMTSTEDVREITREKLNRKVLRVFKKAQEVMPLQDILDDFGLFMTLSTPLNSYSGEITTKLAVAYQLYYKTLKNLGSDEHEYFSKRLLNGDDIGCFALTELGHGSNVRSIQTTAHYDKGTKEFIINTPCQEAMKFWIGGAAKSSNITTAFAQLYIDGKCYGPHAFVVPLRDNATHQPLSGILLGDCGRKEGLQGIDNGFIIFNNIRIPRQNLLNKFSNVTEDGTFQTLIDSIDQRLAMTLGALSTGRMCVALSTTQLLAYGLKIAIRFAAMRQQFGKPGEEESSLIEYPLHQYRLFPLCGAVQSQYYGIMTYVNLYRKNQKHLYTPNNAKLAELHALLSGLKALCSTNSLAGLTECRAACGGLGFSFYAGFVDMMAYVDVQKTWEGDNNVLMQQTGKFLLDLLKNKMKGKQVKKTYTCEWIRTDAVQGEKCLSQTEDDLMTYEQILAMFEFRANLLLQRTGFELSNKLVEDKMHPIDAWNHSQVFNVQALAKAYCELFNISETVIKLKEYNGNPKVNDDTKECLDLLLKLDALNKIQLDIGTWMEAEYFDGHHANLIRNGIRHCLSKLKRHSVALTYSYFPLEEHNDSFLIPSNGDLYNNIVNTLYTAPKAFERISTWQELKKH